jgi:hypothetical protein
MRMYAVDLPKPSTAQQFLTGEVGVIASNILSRHSFNNLHPLRVVE